MIALLVATHGTFGLELLKTAEMVYGKQDNVVAVPFRPGESTDDLIQAYSTALAKLDTSDGVLFLCDLFGGSPFNAASHLATSNEKMDVVSGVNLPMILEVYGARANRSLGEVVDVAKQAGTRGIQSLKSLNQPEEEDL